MLCHPVVVVAVMVFVCCCVAVNVRDAVGQAYSVEQFRLKFVDVTCLDAQNHVAGTEEGNLQRLRDLSSRVDRASDVPALPKVSSPADLPEYLRRMFTFQIIFQITFNLLFFFFFVECRPHESGHPMVFRIPRWLSEAIPCL